MEISWIKSWKRDSTVCMCMCGREERGTAENFGSGSTYLAGRSMRVYFAVRGMFNVCMYVRTTSHTKCLIWPTTCRTNLEYLSYGTIVTFVYFSMILYTLLKRKSNSIIIHVANIKRRRSRYTLIKFSSLLTKKRQSDVTHRDVDKSTIPGWIIESMYVLQFHQSHTISWVIPRSFRHRPPGFVKEARVSEKARELQRENLIALVDSSILKCLHTSSQTRANPPNQQSCNRLQVALRIHTITSNLPNLPPSGVNPRNSSK